MGGQTLKPFGRLLSFDQALEKVMTSVTPLTCGEVVELGLLAGRVLCKDITATLNTPPFNRSAMDGYAVLGEDTFGTSRRSPKTLTLIDSTYAGFSSAKKVEKGQCIAITTGARMPAGANAVLMIEDTERDGDKVTIMRAVSPGNNIGKMGEDITSGELVLKKGIMLSPGKVGVIASQGLTAATVYRKPRVAVMPTGEEIGAVGTKLNPEQIYDINSHTVSAVINQNGGEAVMMGITGDNEQTLKTTLKEALKHDMVVISGGSSVGERDLLYKILDEAGEVLFHGIQVKPGKPTLFAIVEGKPVFGMPGYPTSCLINAYLLLEPAVRRLSNLPPRKRCTEEAVLSTNISGSVGRRQFLTVKLRDGKALPIFKESGAITTTAQADGYIVVAENIDILPKGEMVEVILF